MDSLTIIWCIIENFFVISHDKIFQRFLSWFDIFRPGYKRSEFDWKTSDKVKIAVISLQFNDLQTASYKVDLDKITEEQFNPSLVKDTNPSIIAVDPEFPDFEKNKNTIKYLLVGIERSRDTLYFSTWNQPKSRTLHVFQFSNSFCD